MPTSVTRFAQTSYRLFAHEGTFSIEVPAREDFEATALAFEALGCTVERNLRKRWLKVFCPPR